VSEPARKTWRLASGVYAGMTIAMVVLLAVFAITATQTPPPAIAEIAPQAAEQIKEAPESQSSSVGSADGGLGGEGSLQPTTTLAPEPVPGVTTTAPPVIERARVRRCVGNPPRQTEDPQSPPCVPFWDGDNGGATAKGVTANEIVVVAPCAQQQCPENRQYTHKVYEAYFNSRYEFYGRRLRIVYANHGGPQCANQKAAMTRIDEQLQAFAVIDTNTTEGACFHQEAARRGVLSITPFELVTEAEMQSAHPYLWGYSMAHESLFAGVGEMICARLQGGNAIHSPDPIFQQRPRKFGVILQLAERDGDLPLDPLQRSMAACGAKIDATIVEDVPGFSEQGPTVSQRTIFELKSKEITSVICLCLAFRQQYLPTSATNQGYFPEWIMSSYGGNDSSLWLKVFWTSEQRASIIGVSSRPPQLTSDNNPVCYAAREGDPRAACGTEAGKDETPSAPNIYWSLLVLASGIQMAGPQLTPETFAAALQSTDFPYPADDPTHSGDVGFLDGDHTMTDTFAEYWWSEADAGPNGDDRGTLCYVDQGARRRRGTWPQEDDPFHKGPCDSDGGP